MANEDRFTHRLSGNAKEKSIAMEKKDAGWLRLLGEELGCFRPARKGTNEMRARIHEEGGGRGQRRSGHEREELYKGYTEDEKWKTLEGLMRRGGRTARGRLEKRRLKVSLKSTHDHGKGAEYVKSRKTPTRRTLD